jgi:hypothetical protein
MSLVTKRFADLRHIKNGLPLSMRNIMKYEHQSLLTVPNTFNVYSQYRLNSLNDVNSLLGGHQPPTYDVLSPIYRRNRVKNTYVNATFHNATTRPMRVYFLLSTNGSAPSTSDVADLTNSVGYLGKVEVGRSDSNQGVKKFRRKIPIDYWLGKFLTQNNGQIYNNLSDPWATTNNNPPVVLYLNILFECLDYNVTSTLGMAYTLDFKFDTIWANPDGDIFEDED